MSKKSKSKKSSSSNTLYTAYIRVPCITSLKGTIIDEDGTAITLKYKKPRSSKKMIQRIIPRQQVISHSGEVGSDSCTVSIRDSSSDTLSGEIISIDSDSVVMNTDSGEVTISSSCIYSLEAEIEKEEKKEKKGKGKGKGKKEKKGKKKGKGKKNKKVEEEESEDEDDDSDFEEEESEDEEGDSDFEGEDEDEDEDEDW